MFNPLRGHKFVGGLAHRLGTSEDRFYVLSTQDPVLAKRRFFNCVALDAATYNVAWAFFSWMNQQGGRLDLEVVEFDYLTGTDTVIADVACKIYAILLKKNTTVTAYFKASDHATVSSSTAPEVELRQTTVKSDLLLFPKALPMTTGFTISSDTTSDGNTGSTAGDGAAGCVLLGAA